MQKFLTLAVATAISFGAAHAATVPVQPDTADYAMMRERDLDTGATVFNGRVFSYSSSAGSLFASESQGPIITGSGSGNHSFIGNLNVFFMVTGAITADPVPLLLDYSLTATQDRGSARAGIQVLPFDGAVGASTVADASCPVCVNTGTLSFRAMAGTTYSYTLSISGDGHAGGSWSASADPYIYIDPAYASIDPNYANDIRVVLNPGVANAIAPVPEPASWALMVAGFGLTGAALRRVAKRQERLA